MATRRPQQAGGGGLKAADILEGLQKLFPYYGNSFYAKGKVVKGGPAPLPANLILDITRCCSFGCEFCFATATRDRFDHTPLAALSELFKELKGIDKLTLIGGEPFEHPEIHKILALALRCAQKEVEVFTNGAAIPVEAGKARDWAASLVPAKATARMRLTLAADSWHKKRHGTQRFERLVETCLLFEQDARLSIMFNVTDPRIVSTDYLDLPVIRELLTELSPQLWDLFERRLYASRVEDSFYLNPVIVQGLQGEAPYTEFLRAVDLLFHPENVVTFRNGKSRLLRSLNAMWMEPIPTSLNVGEIERRNFSSQVMDGIVGKCLDFERMPWMKALFIAWCCPAKNKGKSLKQAHALYDTWGMAHPGFAELVERLESDNPDAATPLFEAAILYWRFHLWLCDFQKETQRLASELLGIAMEITELPVELGGRPDFDKVRLPVLHQMLRALSCHEVKGSLLASARDFWRELDRGHGCLVPAIVTGKQSLGGVPESGTIPVILSRTVLETGFERFPGGEAGYLVRPRLILRGNACAELKLDGLSLAAVSLPEKEFLVQVERLLEYWRIIYGPLAPELFRQLHETTDDGLKAALEKVSLLGMYEGSLNRPDLLGLFEYVSFDPNRNAAAYHNRDLMRWLLDRKDYPGYSSEEVKRFKERLTFWLEYDDGR